MDARLVAWARAVKARRHAAPPGLPALWLFTDAGRVPDPRPAVRALPRGIAGVVFRHDAAPGRAALGREIARICRARRLALVVAGDARLARALRAGEHRRGGRHLGPVAPHPRRLHTASAHGIADLRRARRGGVAAAFLSPCFATPSHPDGGWLGPLRWGRVAGLVPGIAVMALGGIDGASIRRLPPGRCAGAGAIGALAG